ncbi:MAG: aspartate 1-decarboxylase [Candidatus Marinimicrobia bacterium]|nr:aspartate 1-decarboxylase [Candidatus Neomarinimicrobiota bacterium]
MKQITLLKSKLHRAIVTQTKLHYEGSITIDRELMDIANIKPYERVQVVNINNGNRFDTYVIEGERGSKQICLNGGAARLAEEGDRIIILSYVQLDEVSANSWKPNILVMDRNNDIK